MARFAVMIIVLTGIVAWALHLEGPRGTLSVLCSNNTQSCEALASAYEEKTGERIDLVRLPTSEALNRLRVTRQSPEFDVWIGGPAEAYVNAASDGLLAQMNARSLDYIPESMRDPERFWAGVYGGILALCVSGDFDGVTPSSWSELADPSYRGTIIAPNPILSGTAATMLWVHYERLGSVAEVVEYMSRLDGNVVTYTDSGTTPATLVAAGKGSIGITFAPYCDSQRRAGEDVVTVYPEDGTGYEVGAVAIVARAPHAEAAASFVEFAISADGQEIGTAGSLQLPTTTQLQGNLRDSLDALPVPVFATDMTLAARIRPDLISAWAKEVRHGTY